MKTKQHLGGITLVSDDALAVIQLAALHGPPDTALYTTYGLDERQPTAEPVRDAMFDFDWLNEYLDDTPIGDW